jgi:hypothetical protein
MSLLAQTTPRRATEIIDASFRFYRVHFAELVVIAALLLVPPALLAAIAPKSLGVVATLLDRLFLIVCQGAIAVLVAAAMERDETLSASDAIRGLGARSGSVVAVAILSGLMAAFGLLLLVVPGIIALAWAAVVVPIVAIERLTGVSAIRRARELTRGHVLHALGTQLVVSLVVFIIAVGAGMTVAFAGMTIGFGDRATELIGSIVLVPIMPLIGVTSALLYYDLRVRSEGADVMALAQDLAAATGA